MAFSLRFLLATIAGVCLLGVSFADKSLPVCGDWSVEVYVVYDVSRSFRHDIPTVKNVIPQLFKDIAKDLPGSKFGFGYFSDKAVKPLGWCTDVCYHNTQPLTTEIATIEKSIADVPLLSGGDAPESQLDALYHGAMQPDVGWSKEEEDSNGKKIARIFVLATDAPYHNAGDATKLSEAGYYFPPHDGGVQVDCINRDYPSVKQVSKAFHYQKLTPMFLVRDDKFDKYGSVYKDLKGKIGRDGVVLRLPGNSEGVADVIKKGLVDITCYTPPGGASAGVIAGATIAAAAGVAGAAGLAYYFMQSTPLAAPDMVFEGEDVEEVIVDKEQMTALGGDDFYG